MGYLLDRRDYQWFAVFGPYASYIGDSVENMKKVLISLFLILGLGFVAAPNALADWSYGTARFSGDQPRNSLNHGGVIIYYNGSLKQTGTSGNTELWECTGDVCVIYPRNYSGCQLQFKTQGGLQVQYL